MARFIKAALAVSALGVLILAGYVVVTVARARGATPTLVRDALASTAEFVPVDRLASDRVRMLVTIQDPGFYEHSGVDLETPGAGITTLTQALTKVLYFPEGFEQGFAKIRQTLIARYALHPLVAKEDQIELFVNVAYLGHEDGRAVVGFGDAARTYFGVGVEELTEPQFLALVAMLVQPNRFHIRLRPDDNAQRVARIEAVLAGVYLPVGLTDVYYDGQETDFPFPQRLALGLLSLVT